MTESFSKQAYRLAVKVIPKASLSEVVGWEGEELKVRLAAVPEKGEANEELIRFFSKKLKIPKSHIQMISGETSRHKRLEFTNLTPVQISALLSLFGE